MFMLIWVRPRFFYFWDHLCWALTIWSNKTGLNKLSVNLISLRPVRGGTRPRAAVCSTFISPAAPITSSSAACCNRPLVSNGIKNSVWNFDDGPPEKSLRLHGRCRRQRLSAWLRKYRDRDVLVGPASPRGKYQTSPFLFLEVKGVA